MTPIAPSDSRFEVILQPIGRRVSVPAGTTLLDAARLAGIELVAICGGEGICGECRVRSISGELSPRTLTEGAELSNQDLDGGFRLACQAEVRSDVKVEIPPTSLTTPQRLQTEGQDIPDDFDPLIHAVEARIDPGDISDLRSDLTRVKQTLADLGFPNLQVDLGVLAALPGILRAARPGERLQFVLRKPAPHSQADISIGSSPEALVAVLPSGSRFFGLAVDIGTTKIAAYLVDMQTGLTVARAGAMNPQISYGEDVISRITYANHHEEGGHTLQTCLAATLNSLVKDLTAEAQANPGQVVEAVIVGNTCMHHLFAGLPVTQLGVSPYVAAVSDALNFPAENVGLKIAAGALVYMPPNIAGYVGADHIAMIVGAGLKNPVQTTIALDIGTNTEISLFHAGQHWSCSCASGPAFEGAHITDGMRAADGAIERLQIHGEEVQVKTISDQPAAGICGSGILDAIAELRRNSLIDHRGVFKGQHPNLHLQTGKGAPPSAFVLASADKSAAGHEIKVTRFDINEIQLAKAAIRTGVETLLSEAGISDEDIQQFIIAGAFGTYLNLESAIRIGMFPNIPRERFAQIGNAAGGGARSLLVSARQRIFAEQLTTHVNYVELATNSSFHKNYINSLAFP